MRKQAIFAAIALTVTFIGVGSYLYFFSSSFLRNQEVPENRNEELEQMEFVRLTVAKGIDLKLVRLYKDKQVYVTESPITNAQYAAAVTEKSVSAPELPHELYSDGGISTASWQKITWRDGAYPKGQDTGAVLFVNRFDALDYCLWLQEKHPNYGFRLSTRMERLEWNAEKSIPNQGLLDSDSAFPRPAFGPGAIRVHERFWLAPWTHELVDSDASFIGVGTDDKFKESYLRRFAPSGRYLPMLGGSLGTARVLPTAFRVIAVKNER